MGKKGAFRLFFWLALALFLSSGLAEADIILTPWEKNTYNLGESIILNGYVLPQETFRGRFRIRLDCPSEQTELLVKLYDFEAGKKLDFQEQLFILTTQTGECFFTITLDNLKESKETKKSSPLTVSDQLDLILSSDKEQIQLGEKIKIDGSVQNLAQEPIDGSVTLKVIKEAETFITLFSKVEKGRFNYSLGPLFMPSGEYKIIISAKDLFGNQMEKSLFFNLNAELNLEVVADKTEALPGETIYLIGKISYPSSETPPDFTVKINFGSESYQLSQNQEEFSFDLPLDEKQPAGSESLLITVTDAFGNKGEAAFEITIKQKPTSLQLVLDKKEAAPGESLSFSGKLLDQTGKPLTEEITLEIWQRKKLLWQNSSLPDQPQHYLVPLFTSPQSLTLKASYQALLQEESLRILEVRQIQSYLNDTKVIIENTGNVRYQELLNFTLIGNQKYYLNKEIDLRPGEKVEFDLSQEVPSDNYTVMLPHGPAVYQNITIVNPEFEKRLNESLSGLAKSLSEVKRTSFSLFLTILFLILISLGLYFYYHRHSKKIKKLISKAFGTYEEKVEHHQKKAAKAEENFQKEKTEKEKLHDLFSKFADQEIVKEIVNKPDLSYGEEREITVMFADLRDFTQFCKKTSLQSLHEILNHFFESMYQIIKINRGVVNEYLGDALFVLFNAPNKIINHPLAAVKTALAMRKELKTLNQKLIAKGYSPLKIGIGINTGKARIGILGVNRIKYAAIGDTVVIASRLESEAKAGEILVAEETYNLVKDNILADYLSLRKVKHMEESLKVYNILGIK